jgi:hypothetical protein
MLRKLTIALAAGAAAALFVPDAALARGGFGGGHGGGFGGFHGGGFHGGGFHHHGFGFAPGLAFGVGLGLAAPYGYYGDPYYDPSYVDDDYGGDCYLVRRRVMTRHGRRLRTVQVCN